jgi:hypothetical protein
VSDPPNPFVAGLSVPDVQRLLKCRFNEDSAHENLIYCLDRAKSLAEFAHTALSYSAAISEQEMCGILHILILELEDAESLWHLAEPATKLRGTPVAGQDPGEGPAG